MGNILTFDEILNLPRKILKITSEYEEYSGLLNENTILKYYHKNLKQEMNVYFNRYKDIKYSYPMDYYYVSSSNISIDSVKSHSISDPVGRFASRKIDDDFWLNQFYHHVLNLATKLVMVEAIYLVDTFFANRSEEAISEEIGVCRATLQKIKKSCLIKMLLEFQDMNTYPFGN